MFKNSILKWAPQNEQSLYERKLMKVMEDLGVENYNFNWDRHNCFIEFRYQENAYRLEHSLDRARKKGIILRNGLDCLKELAESLEDLCRIIKRGTNNLEMWISGMKQSSDQKMPESKEDFQIRYESSDQHEYSEYNREDLIPFANDRIKGIRNQTAKTDLSEEINVTRNF